MKDNKIYENYLKFGISSHQMPKYDNPSDFAKGFQKVSILREGNVYYSDSVTRKSAQDQG